MNDTPNHIRQLQTDITMQKSPAERFKDGLEMIDYGRFIVENSIRNQKPTITERELVVEVFKRYYANEFSPVELEKITAFLLTLQSPKNK
jgi:DNA replication protein DnaD